MSAARWGGYPKALVLGSRWWSREGLPAGHCPSLLALGPASPVSVQLGQDLQPARMPTPAAFTQLYGRGEGLDPAFEWACPSPAPPSSCAQARFQKQPRFQCPTSELVLGGAEPQGQPEVPTTLIVHCPAGCGAGRRLQPEPGHWGGSVRLRSAPGLGEQRWVPQEDRAEDEPAGTVRPSALEAGELSCGIREGASSRPAPRCPVLGSISGATVEETYGKSMAKLAKMATNGTQLGTFAPLWEVFRVSSDKLALCHLELVKKLQDLLKEIARYGEEQGKAHKKSKEEVSGTLEAIQLLQGVAQLVPKSKENYQSKCLEAERLRREGTNQKELDKAERKSKKAAEALRRAVEKYNVARADFEQRMLDSAVRFQELEEIHLRHMKGLISSYSHSVEDTHVQVGQVHEEFKQNVENIGIETLLRRFAESKGTGHERPGVLDFEECRTAPAQEGPKRSLSKAFHPRAEPERPRARRCGVPRHRRDLPRCGRGGIHCTA
ncbi:glomulin [Platysternon megacephalum]|uniref:Glomulin n=1 Tax=Platysternon megacephalum TaxID=55544 RepID=A0A4D9E8V6_9SAUR|nr:glomulin [Platysternon megacephalum]